MMSDVQLIASSTSASQGNRISGQIVGIEHIRITGRRSPDVQHQAQIQFDDNYPQTPQTPIEAPALIKGVAKLEVGIPPPSENNDAVNVTIQPCENPEDILVGMTISKMKTSHPSFYYQNSSPRARLTVKPGDSKISPDYHMISTLRPQSPSMTLKSFGLPQSIDIYKLDQGQGSPGGNGKPPDSPGTNRKLEAAIIGETIGSIDYFSDSLFDEEKAKIHANNIVNLAVLDRLAKSSTLIQQIQQQQQIKAQIYASKIPSSGALSPKNMGQPVFIPMSPRGGDTLPALAVNGTNNNLPGNSNNIGGSGYLSTGGDLGGGSSSGMVMVTSMNRIDQPDSHYFINSKDVAASSKLQLVKTMSQLRHYKTGTSPDKKVHLIQQQLSTSTPDLLTTMRTSNSFRVDSNNPEGDCIDRGSITAICHPSCACGTNGRPLSPLQHQHHQPQCQVHKTAQGNNTGGVTVSRPATAEPRPTSSNVPNSRRGKSATRVKEEALERMRQMHPDSPAAMAASLEKNKKAPVVGGATSKYPIDHKDLVVRSSAKLFSIPHVIPSQNGSLHQHSMMESSTAALSMSSSHRAGSVSTPLYTPATFRQPKARDTSADSIFAELESSGKFNPPGSPHGTTTIGTIGGDAEKLTTGSKVDDGASVQDSLAMSDAYKDDEKELFLQTCILSADQDAINQKTQVVPPSPEVSAQLNLTTLSTDKEKKTSTVPLKVNKKYQRDGEDLHRPSSPSKSRSQSPSRHSDDEVKEKVQFDPEKEEPQLMREPGPGHPNNLHCTNCIDKEAILWCTRCIKAFCAICWNRVNHHTFYNMVSTPQQVRSDLKETKKLQRQKLETQKSTSSLRPFNESTESLMERSHFSPGKSYSHAILFTSYVGDNDVPSGGGLGRTTSTTKLDRNLIPAPVPQIDNPVVHFVDYPNPPVFLDGKGNIHEHNDKHRFSGGRIHDEPNHHDGFTGKLKPHGPLRPFTSPGDGRQQSAAPSGHGSGWVSPKSRSSPINMSRSQSEFPSRSSSPKHSRPMSSNGRLMSSSGTPSKQQRGDKQKDVSDTGLAVDLEMSDSIASSHEFLGQVTSSVHYITKAKMLEMMTGRRLPLKMSNVAPHKQIYLRPSLPYKGEMRKKKKAKPAFALTGAGGGGVTIAKYGAPPKHVEQLTGIAYDLNQSIDWKAGTFQSGAYYGTEHPERPHTSHGSPTAPAAGPKEDIRPRVIKIYQGVPVYVARKEQS